MLRFAKGQRGEWGLGWLAGALLCAAAAQGAEKSTLHVEDESGAPVPKFEAMMLVNREWTPEWVEGQQGSVQIFPLGGAQTIDVAVRADGFASKLVRFEGEERAKWLAGEAKITLQRGDEVEVRFKLPEGVTWPQDVAGEFYFSEHAQHISNAGVEVLSDAAKRERDMNMLGASAPEPGFAKLRLAKDSPPFSVKIDAPGFLRACHLGPFRHDDLKDGQLEIELPRPATLEVTLDPGKTEEKDLPYKGASISIALRPAHSKQFTFIAQEDLEAARPQYRAADLPAGDFYVSLSTIPKSSERGRPGEAHGGMFRESRQVTLRAGQTENVNVDFVPLDPDAFRGERTAKLRFSRFDGSAVTGKKVKVTFRDPHYGSLTVFEGEVPESGLIEIPKLTDKPVNGRPAGYMVAMNNQHVGYFTFKPEDEEFPFKLPPGEGDQAPDVEVTNIATGDALKISALRGKVVCIDFWATWCGPCQDPMAHLDGLAVSKREAWNDKVVILPISIDDKRETVPPHLESKGWSNLDHYWAGGADAGWKSPAAQAYVISGVPTSLVLDREGKILWRGHPGDTSDGGIESRIEAALE